MNELQKLLIKYPDKPWDWDHISWNLFSYKFERYKKYQCYKKFPFIIKRRNNKIKEYSNTLPFIRDIESIILDYLIEF